MQDPRQYRAAMDADEAAWMREQEWQRIARRLDGLYAAQRAGDDSLLTAQRIQRCEALQMALCGHPEALAQHMP